MSQLSISEAGTVQFPMVKHAVEIGWTPISPDEARQKRGDDSGMLFRDELGRLNQVLAAESEETELVVAGRVVPLGPAQYDTGR